jgi:hypothetical protein
MTRRTRGRVAIQPGFDSAGAAARWARGTTRPMSGVEASDPASGRRNHQQLLRLLLAQPMGGRGGAERRVMNSTA